MELNHNIKFYLKWSDQHKQTLKVEKFAKMLVGGNYKLWFLYNDLLREIDLGKNPDWDILENTINIPYDLYAEAVGWKKYWFVSYWSDFTYKTWWFTKEKTVQKISTAILTKHPFDWISPYRIIFYKEITPEEFHKSKEGQF